MGDNIERITGKTGEAVTFMRDDIRDFFDHEYKNANYLLVAHGAGIVGCLASLKDYAATPQLKGVGIFIVMFVVGFMLAAMGSAALSQARANMLTWITHSGEKPRTAMLWIFLLMSSLGVLMLALIMVIYKFYKL